MAMHIRVATLLCVLGILASACQSASAPAGGPSASATLAADPNAEILVGVQEITPVVDPQIEISANSQHYKYAVFDALTYVAPTGELQPALATSWKSVAPTVWEFKLRAGVKFSDGTLFGAKDIVFAITRIVDPKTKSLVVGRIPGVSKAEQVDDQTLRITTAGPDPVLPRRVATVYIISAEAFQKGSSTNALAQILGTGPFKATEYKQNERITLERVDTSWRGRPKSAKVTMTAMPEVSTRMSALQSGQIDIAQGLPADQIATAKAAGLGVASGVSARTCTLITNNRNGPPLSNVQVRQAINYAIDKDALVKDLWQGVAEPAPGQIVGPDGFGYNPNIKAYPYDQQKAKSLLAQAGYPQGFSIKLVASKGLFIGDYQVEQALAGMLAKVGINAELDVQETAAWRANQQSGKQTTMVYTCLNYFPVLDADLPLSLLESTWAYKWYSNPNYDKAFQESRVLLDQDQRLQKLRGLMQILYDEPPGVFLYREPVIFAYSKKIQGVEARSDQALFLDPISKSR